MERALNVMTQPKSARRGAARGRRTRQEILATAVQLATAEGLEGLTIGRLAEELGMSKSGLFAHFGSKEELQLATIETAREIFVEEVVQPVLPAERGLARLHAMLESWISYGERRVFKGGCFFHAAAAEFDGRPGPIRDRLVTLEKSWLDAFIAEVRQCQSLSHIDPKIDPAQVAFELHAYSLESNWAFQLFEDKHAFDRARAAARRCLESVATPAGRKILSSRTKSSKKVKK